MSGSTSAEGPEATEAFGGGVLFFQIGELGVANQAKRGGVLGVFEIGLDAADFCGLSAIDGALKDLVREGIEPAHLAAASGEENACADEFHGAGWETFAHEAEDFDQALADDFVEHLAFDFLLGKAFFVDGDFDRADRAGLITGGISFFDFEAFCFGK